jgi:drug/metabolite transporter (DMT)-like permease
MEKSIHIILLLIAGASVAIADILIKKATNDGISFTQTLKSPYLMGAIALYVVQVVAFAYIFTKNWDLATVGIINMVVYSIMVISAGVFLFNEKITMQQYIGIFIALAGIILIHFQPSHTS